MVRVTLEEWVAKYIEGVRRAEKRYIEKRFGPPKPQQPSQYRVNIASIAAAIPIVISPGYDFLSNTSVTGRSGSSMATPLIDLTSFLDTIIRLLNTIIGLLLLIECVLPVLRVLQSLLDQRFSHSG
jgi:hypothetical protein